MYTIAVTGPESTGKSMISQYLAKMLKGLCIPEFARDYIIGINRKYNYDDLVYIGKMQVSQRREMEKEGHDLIILDTWLIITKIWFLEVYGKCPAWVDEELWNYPVDLYLLFEPDIPWIPDLLRENGGERRKYLFDRYLNEIIRTGVPFEIINGLEDKRYSNAFNKAKKHFLK